MKRLRTLEYEVLKAAVVARRYVDIARSTGTSPSYAARVLARLEEKGFRVRGGFDYRVLSLQETFILAPYSPPVYEKVVPFVVEKAIVEPSKKRRLIALRVLVPVGAAEEVLDILQLEPEVFSEVERFTWNPYASRATRFEAGLLSVDPEGLSELVEEGAFHRPSPAAQPIIPDEVDLMLVAEITRNPFLKLSKLSAERGLSGQVLSYHYVKHVKNARLDNEVRLEAPGETPGKLFEVYTPPGSEERVAWALSNLYYTREALAAPGRGSVYVFTYPQPSEEGAFLDLLRRHPLVEDYAFRGYVYAAREYTVPFGGVVGEGGYVLDAMYEALYSRSRKTNFIVYEI